MSNFDSDPLVVRTAEGLVRGSSSASLNFFKGLRYGEDTSTTRFEPPVPVQPWNDVRTATELGAPCIQRNPDTPLWLDPQEEGSEDCLFLNVWSPKKASGLPVMVWIHGGAYQWGSGGAPGYDGAALAERGEVVVVSVNHRINVFGYLYFGGVVPELTNSANLGQLDLIEALMWVQRNIAAFGGDPANVTIFGESGGAGKIGSLLAMPAARGLFAKAVLQSGAPTRVLEPDQHDELARAVLAELDFSVDAADRLRSVDAKRLFAALEAVLGPIVVYGDFQLLVAPVLHADTIPYQLNSPEGHKLWADVPVILGITEEETAYFVLDEGRIPEPQDDAALTSAARALFTDLTVEESDRLLNAYRAALPWADRARLLVAVTTGHWIWRATQQQAELKALQQAAPAFVYLFGWRDPFAGGLWAVHGADVGFVFDEFEVPDYLEFDVDSATLRAAADPTGGRYAVRDVMMDAWVNFARHGTPKSTLLPPWPAYTAEKRSVMRIDGQSHVLDDPWGPDVRLALDRRAPVTDLDSPP